MAKTFDFIHKMQTILSKNTINFNKLYNSTNLQCYRNNKLVINLTNVLTTLKFRLRIILIG